MTLLIEIEQKRALASVYADTLKVIPAFEIGETRDISVGLIKVIVPPVSAKLFAQQSLAGWTFTAVLGAGENVITADLETSAHAPTADATDITVDDEDVTADEDVIILRTGSLDLSVDVVAGAAVFEIHAQHDDGAVQKIYRRDTTIAATL